MLLKNKIAVIYGGGGAIGGAVARAFAREGARVFLAELSFQDYAHPITAYTRTNFLTAKAVAWHMVKQGSGVILTLSTPGSRMSGSGFLGYA